MVVLIPMKSVINYLLYTVLSFYCIVDAYQTKLLLDLGAYEVNPLLSYLVEISGTWTVILGVKVFWLGLLGYLLLKYNKDRKTL